MNEWLPIGARYEAGAWWVLWARQTNDGWEFRQGLVGSNHITEGTPGGVVTDD